MAFFKGDFMKKYEIVKTHEEFDNIIKTGKKKKNAIFILYQKPNDERIARFGIAVGKKIGNAVFRNKQKRRLRMILTNQKKEFSKGFDYIIIMKEKSKELNYIELEKKLLELLKEKNS